MSREAARGSDAKPDWRPRAVRCGLEVTLVVLSTTYLTLQIGSSLVSGVVLVGGLVAAVAVLFWCLDDLVVDWVRYASAQAQRRRRRRVKREKRADRPDERERQVDDGEREPAK